jgi:hypothetical protein
MNINANIIGYYIVFSIVLALISYFILKGNRKSPSKDAFVILLLMIVPPFGVIALFIFYLKNNKVN